jgi:PAS domain S-box-containing protein
VVNEDTQQVIAERRIATLRDLGSDPSVVQTEDEMTAFTARQLSRNDRDLPFTLTYLFDDDGGAHLAGSTGVPEGHPAAAATLPADGSGVWPIAPAAAGTSTTVDLRGSAFGALASADWPTGFWDAPPTQALLVPLVPQGGSPSGLLVAGLNRYRPLDDGYCDFVSLVAGHIAAGVGLARSYQAQQRRAEELAELDRAKTAFFANISHEFRTPLTLILDPVNELREADLGAEVREELDTVWRNGLRLTRLVNTLLDFSRIEAGRTQGSYAAVDLGAITAELASVFRSATERAGLELEVDVAALGEPVYIDHDMWEKVIFNLLSNAVKFTFDGGITVRVRRDGDHAQITVADTGIGVPEAEMPRLFERFHRIENTRARSHEGSGIGLALVKELVELHGGTITATSAENAGTVFTIRIPFGREHLPSSAIAATPAARRTAAGADLFVEETLRWIPGGGADAIAGGTDTPATTSGLPGVPQPDDGMVRVLVADDNADMRDYLTRLLRNDGYHVDAVLDGVAALEAVRTDPPDIVISDVMMPRLDGLALVAELRADRRTASVPVLLLSARAGQEASISGLRAGADDYLVKPFAAAELLARVRANVNLARLRDHHARWRAALIDSLQEAFFICDAEGTVVEMNSAFADILGYDAAGLPYPPVQPWWPSADRDPEGHRMTQNALRELMSRPNGRIPSIPVIHRDGHRLWVTVTFSHAEDPDTGQSVIVGTLRDVTADHYVVQRETALATLNEALAQADSLDDAVYAAAEELRSLWNARRVVAATLPANDPVGLGDDEAERPAPEPTRFVSVGEPATWASLSAGAREAIVALRDGDLLAPELSQAGAAGVALQYPRGVLVLYTELHERRHLAPEDHTLLTVLAGRLGQGLQRVHQIDQQRETALALQHAILGPTVSSGFAVRYEPAGRPLQVGGDWYDVVDLDDGRLGLIVGDCVGHGLTAATIMGQLRSACRALLLEHPSPAATLAALDRVAARLPGARCTTAFCAVLDPMTGVLDYSCAGHPPPILVRADRSTALLDQARATPLGLRYTDQRPQARTVIAPRSTLLLYTDGLVERRRESIDDGIARAGDVVQGNRATSLDELADVIMARLSPEGGYMDDVALLLYRQPGPLQVDLGAVDDLAASRTALRSWLDRVGVPTDQALDVLIAAGEALANAIEHGHRETPGPVSLRAVALADSLLLTVADAGSWKEPDEQPSLNRGRGLALMRALMHDVTIDTRTSGTTVHMHARIG